MENGSSIYFETKLYPLFNEFERKLRKLLYLTSAIKNNNNLEENNKQNDNSKKKESDSMDDVKNTINNINGLEVLELGIIFQALFVDKNIQQTIHKFMNENSNQLSQKDILEKINETDEITFWKQFMGDNVTVTLQSNYNVIRKYRNDIMHAHNIGYEAYMDANKLIKIINKELDKEIDIILKNQGIEIRDNFNDALNRAIDSVLNEYVLGEIINSDYFDDIKRLSNYFFRINVKNNYDKYNNFMKKHIDYLGTFDDSNLRKIGDTLILDSKNKEKPYTICPDCGVKITSQNDGGNGFCIDCAEKH